MKTRLLTASLIGALSLAGTAAPAFADGEEAGSPFSGTLTLTSDYRFRGVSQTDSSVALQGSIDYAHSSGFFVGAWASNIDFNDEATYDSAIEVDLYAGFTFALSDSTEATIKGVYYWYPDADTPPLFPDYDYFEVIGSLSHNFGKATATIEVAYSPDFFLEVGDAFAVTGGLAVPLCDKLWFFDGGLEGSGHLGYQSFDDTGLEDYTYWDLGLTASAGIFALDVRYVDTDVDDAVCTDICDSTVVVSGILSFGG